MADLSNNNFCENRMTGSIVALFVKWKVYERACERLIKLVMKIELLKLRYFRSFAVLTRYRLRYAARFAVLVK